MHEQYITRCDAANMTCETWSTQTGSATCPRNILATIERTESPKFHEYVKTLVAKNRLARIIVDEAHIALTHEHFRPIMQTLQWVGSQNVQVVLQSATVPPHLVNDLFATFGITHYKVCRGHTCRSNVSYNVIKTAHIDHELVHIVTKHHQRHPQDQIIIFVRSRKEAEQYAKLLDIPFCHANIPKQNFEELMTGFRAGTTYAMVATCYVGVALDVSRVNLVIHVDIPYDMLSFIQETGRVGRLAGSVAWSYIICNPDKRPADISMPDRFGIRIMEDFVKNEDICRRLYMDMYNDGVASPCSMMVGVSHMCDVCQRSLKSRPDRGASTTFGSDDIKAYLPGPAYSGESIIRIRCLFP